MITFFKWLKHWSNFRWKISPATVIPNGITVYWNLPNAVLKVVKMRLHLIPDANNPFHNCIPSWCMNWQSSEQCPLGFKSYGSRITALLRFVGSRHMWSLGLPSTSMKLLIHGVASFTGLMTPSWSMLSISFLKASLRWMGTGLHGVCFSVMFISTCMWYGGLGNLPIPSNMSRYFDNIFSLLVIIMPGSCFWTVFLDVSALPSGSYLWSDTSYFDQWTLRAVIFVFLGWSMVLVIRLAHGGR